jgi:hypothetical protein
MYNHDLDGDQVELLIDKFATNLEGIAYTRGRSTNDKHSVRAVNRGAFGIPAGTSAPPGASGSPLVKLAATGGISEPDSAVRVGDYVVVRVKTFAVIDSRSSCGLCTIPPPRRVPLPTTPRPLRRSRLTVEQIDSRVLLIERSRVRVQYKTEWSVHQPWEE